MEESEIIGAIALNAAFGYEPATARRIITELGSAEAVYHLPPAELDALLGPWSKYRPLITPQALDKAAAQYRLLKARGYGFLAQTDPAYPEPLLQCPDPPVCLYVRSATPADELFRGAPMISIVGTRDITPYGSTWCAGIVEALSQAPCKPVIVSGLAIGVDITAHLSALERGLPTIAVSPTGIEDVYPVRHSGAAARIAGAPSSALITDFPPGTGAQACTFLRRNRIIAGLSQATILVESKLKGGGTMTARLAADYGRDVYALPGRIDDTRSQGCNLLIQEKIAESISSLAGLGASLGLGRFNLRRKADVAKMVEERYRHRDDVTDLTLITDIARIVRSYPGITVEQISARLGRPYPEISAMTGLLESDGIIRMDLLQRCSTIVKIV